jgi:hypothetical protein
LKEKVSASVLLTIAVTLLSMGVSFLKEGVLTEGCVCVVAGFATLLAAVYLIEKGIVEKLKVNVKYG